MYYLYVLQCTNGAYYTGITTDPKRRWAQHCAGKAAKYTRAFPPEKMIALWEVGESRAVAQQLECQFKALSRAQKQEKVRQQATALLRGFDDANEFALIKGRDDGVP